MPINNLSTILCMVLMAKLLIFSRSCPLTVFYITFHKHILDFQQQGMYNYTAPQPLTFASPSFYYIANEASSQPNTSQQTQGDLMTINDLAAAPVPLENEEKPKKKWCC